MRYGGKQHLRDQRHPDCVHDDAPIERIAHRSVSRLRGRVRPRRPERPMLQIGVFALRRCRPPVQRSNPLLADAASAYDEQVDHRSSKPRSTPCGLPSVAGNPGDRRHRAAARRPRPVLCHRRPSQRGDLSGSGAPVDLSDDGLATRNAMRAQGQQLIAMDTENCPPIDRVRAGGRSSPASVEEIVAACVRPWLMAPRRSRRVRRQTATASSCRKSPCPAQPAAECPSAVRLQECRSADCGVRL